MYPYLGSYEQNSLFIDIPATPYCMCNLEGPWIELLSLLTLEYVQFASVNLNTQHLYYFDYTCGEESPATFMTNIFNYNNLTRGLVAIPLSLSNFYYKNIIKVYKHTWTVGRSLLRRLVTVSQTMKLPCEERQIIFKFLFFYFFFCLVWK